MPGRIDTSTASFLARPKSAAELIGERSEPLRRRRIPALGVLAHFRGLLRVPDRFGAQTDATARRIDVEHDHLDVGADGKRSSDLRFLRNAGFPQWDETGAPGARNTNTPNFW